MTILESNPNITAIYCYKFANDNIGFVFQEYDNYFHIMPVNGPVVQNDVHQLMSKLCSTGDYRKITMELFASLFTDLETFWLSPDQYISILSKPLRKIRVSNRYISDEQNSFFEWLGFEKFYPSSHISISKHNKLFCNF